MSKMIRFGVSLESPLLEKFYRSNLGGKILKND